MNSDIDVGDSRESNRTYLRKAHSSPGQSDDEDETEKKELIESDRKHDSQIIQSLEPKALQRGPSHDSVRHFLKPTKRKKTNDHLKDSLIKEEEEEEEGEEEDIRTDTTDDIDDIKEYQENDAEMVNDHANCIECVKAIPVLSADDLEPGDHFVIYGKLYDHHGIIVEKSEDGETFEIIEVTNTSQGTLTGLTKFLGGKAAIKRSSKQFDFKKVKIRLAVYRHRFTKMQTIERAQNEFLDEEKSKNYKYNLFGNNCEHFATFCATGKEISVQVTKLKVICRLFLSSGFVGISDELERNFRMYENKIICEDCFQMNNKLLGVEVKPIVNGEDIEKGDIIRYSYWNLWHEAVVTEKMKTRNSSVECKVAHYAFCGLFSHRTIKEERLVIQINGKYSKLNYTWPSYDVYEPNDVVERARQRIGEQSFVFFSNDSSHFARWCKLRLHKIIKTSSS